jgi:hypothetical protein
MSFSSRIIHFIWNLLRFNVPRKSGKVLAFMPRTKKKPQVTKEEMACTAILNGMTRGMK